jgi:MoaA/NifB/PqqE/SkfB family radical SAM enzyme
MFLSISKRFIKETEFRILLRFLWYCGWKNVKAVQQFKKRIKKGVTFPAFIFISVTNRCNLKCQGCWVVEAQTNENMDMERLNKIIIESKAQGISFFGILGGEPFLYENLIALFREHRDCYFLLFTNGTMIDASTADTLARLKNVTPLISIEGRESISDIRRGGQRVFRRTWDGLKNCTSRGLVTGVATSVCKSNFEDLVSEEFIDELIDSGVMYLWYYIYRPVGANPMPGLALSEGEIIRLREFIVEQRSKKPIVLVDAYWDHEGKALCPAAVGISHHINPSGFVEPCPPIQFSRDQVVINKSLHETIAQSEFLSAFRSKSIETTRGCILMENPSELCALVEEQNAIDTSGRNKGVEELKYLQKIPGHDMPGKEIPERSWFYRFAKKYWFFGFGAYG